MLTKSLTVKTLVGIVILLFSFELCDWIARGLVLQKRRRTCYFLLNYAPIVVAVMLSGTLA